MSPERTGGATHTDPCHAGSGLLFLLTLTGLLPTGCGGRASLTLVPTDQTRISRTDPFMVTLHVHECVYGTEGERIAIALADENVALVGEYGKRSVVTSIVLDGLPADQARDYRLDRNSIRGRFRHGAQHVRFASVSGIVALWVEKDGRLTGRLRAFVKEQHFQVLMGWTGNRRTLLVGDFVAVQDRERTAEWLRQSEADGMERGLPPGDYGQPHPVTGPPVPPADPQPEP